MICNNCKINVDESNSFSLMGCNHNHCFKCLQSYVCKNVAITIKCPLNKCQTEINEKIIRECLTNSELIRYDQLLVLNSSKKFVKCFTENCTYIVYLEDDVENFSCKYCMQTNCLKCKKRHNNKCNQKGQNEAEISRAADSAMSEHIRRDLEESFNSGSYIPNPEPFECQCCSDYFLPRKGLTLRNCHHCFCKPCFQNTYESKTEIQDFRCSLCDAEINEIETINVIGKQKFNDLILRSMRYKFFQCKYPDCKGCWDSNGFKGCFSCPVCNRINCHECEDIHEQMSCESFRETEKYRVQQNRQKASIKCYFCNYPISKLKGGCGSLICNCRRNICQYTGKAAGNIGSDSCGCTKDKRCHPNCQFGCITE